MNPRALLHVCGVALMLSTLPGCGGKRIRLGDATAGTDGGAPNAGGSASAGSSVSGDGGSGNGTCLPGRTLASEVLWIGDSWIQIPGTQHTRVRDLARASGAIGASEDYANEAAPAADMATIAEQYRVRQSRGVKVKVLLMDGGTWDPIAAQAKGEPIGPAMDNAISTFEAFLSEVAADGTVEHVVYFLVPELPSIPGVATMRPSLQAVCAASAVPCHFLDLQPLWLGHAAYTASDGIQASEAGARVIADEIWGIMLDNCIAQAP